MIKYEYKTLRKEVEQTDKYLNELGIDGWKIVGTTCTSYGLQRIFMMREIHE
jgi:hypothetical protein